MIPFDELLDAAIGELAPAATERVEEHLLGCDPCARAYEAILALGEGVSGSIRAGELTMVVPTAMLDELGRHELITRTYRVPANGAVQCTATSEDIYVVAEYLGADYTGVSRVDIITPWARLEDVPFDRVHRRVATLVSGEDLRKMPTGSRRYQLVSVEGGRDRTLAEYTMHHTAFSP